MRVNTKVSVNDIQQMRARDSAYYERMVRQPLEAQLEALGWQQGDDYAIFQWYDLNSNETIYMAEAEIEPKVTITQLGTISQITVSTKEVET